MRRLSVLLSALVLLGTLAVPAGAAPPGFEEVPWGDGATCDLTGDGEGASYGTPGYPDEETQTVLQKVHAVVDGQGVTHQSVTVVLDGVRYDLLEGQGPASFLVHGTIRASGHGGTGRSWGSLTWRWTLTDLDGNLLDTNGGTIVDFDPRDEGRLVQVWRGPCSEP